MSKVEQYGRQNDRFSGFRYTRLRRRYSCEIGVLTTKCMDIANVAQFRFGLDPLRRSWYSADTLDSGRLGIVLSR